MATVVTIVGPSIAALVRSNLKATQRLTEVIIISINGILVTGGSFSFNRRHLVSRKLDGHIDIEYEIFLEELCGTQTCDDAQSVADAFYESVTVGMQREIDSGAFSETLEQKAQGIGEILELAITSSDFSDLVVVILALSSIWYPAWTTGKYCLNDGEQRELFVPLIFFSMYISYFLRLISFHLLLVSLLPSSLYEVQRRILAF